MGIKVGQQEVKQHCQWFNKNIGVGWKKSLTIQYMFD